MKWTFSERWRPRGETESYPIQTWHVRAYIVAIIEQPEGLVQDDKRYWVGKRDIFDERDWGSEHHLLWATDLLEAQCWLIEHNLLPKE